MLTKVTSANNHIFSVIWIYFKLRFWKFNFSTDFSFAWILLHPQTFHLSNCHWIWSLFANLSSSPFIWKIFFFG